MGNTPSRLLKMAIYSVFSHENNINNGDFHISYANVYQRVCGMVFEGHLGISQLQAG